MAPSASGLTPGFFPEHGPKARPCCSGCPRSVPSTDCDPPWLGWALLPGAACHAPVPVSGPAPRHPPCSSCPWKTRPLGPWDLPSWGLQPPQQTGSQPRPGPRGSAPSGSASVRSLWAKDALCPVVEKPGNQQAWPLQVETHCDQTSRCSRQQPLRCAAPLPPPRSGLGCSGCGGLWEPCLPQGQGVGACLQ